MTPDEKLKSLVLTVSVMVAFVMLVAVVLFVRSPWRHKK
jgi:hypothetical protein